MKLNVTLGDVRCGELSIDQQGRFTFQYYLFKEPLKRPGAAGFRPAERDGQMYDNHRFATTSTPSLG